jgi:hypothetical protein
VRGHGVHDGSQRHRSWRARKRQRGERSVVLTPTHIAYGLTSHPQIAHMFIDAFVDALLSIGQRFDRSKRTSSRSSRKGRLGS